MLDDLDIGDADEFNHQEGGRAHHRRHDLAVDRRGHLDRAGLFRAEPNLFHKRDGKGAGGHNVRDRRSGNQAGHGRSDHRRFCRAAAECAQSGKGKLDEVVARASLVEDCAEQHEQEHKGGRYA